MKIKEEQLKKIQEQQKALNSIMHEIGVYQIMEVEAIQGPQLI